MKGQQDWGYRTSVDRQTLNYHLVGRSAIDKWRADRRILMDLLSSKEYVGQRFEVYN